MTSFEIGRPRLVARVSPIPDVRVITNASNPDWMKNPSGVLDLDQQWEVKETVCKKDLFPHESQLFS